MGASEAKNLPPTIPNLDAGIYSLATTILFLIVGAFLIWRLWDQLYGLLDAVSKRIRAGAAIKIGSWRLEAFRVAPDLTTRNQHIQIRPDQTREHERARIYADNQMLFVAHRLFPSSEPNQLYDVLLQLVAHRGSTGAGNLNAVERVEYFLGPMWDDNVLISTERNSRFAVVVSAHGSGFLCHARIFLHDKAQPICTWRYVDFEHGLLGVDVPYGKPSVDVYEGDRRETGEYSEEQLGKTERGEK